MIDVHVDVGTRDVSVPLLSRAVTRALHACDIARAEISLTLLDDDAMRTLNRRHLDHDSTTDVLAFALWQPGDEVVVGDIYVGFDQALRQAADEGVEPGEELVRLAVHGTLHVAGMDHPEDAEARAETPLYRLQERLVGALMGQRAT
jgi:probable rRNA maturation factor